MQGERGAIKKAEEEKIATLKNEAYEKKVNYCYMPAFIEWCTWFGHLLFWDNNYSKMEIEIKKFNDAVQKEYEDIKNLSEQYARRDVIKAEDIIKRTCKKFKLKYKSKNCKIHRIGIQGENGLELSPNPDIDYLKKQKDLIQIMIIKALKGFYNEKIPITREELERILATRPLFIKYNNKLEIVLKNFNMLVAEYEEKNKKEKEILNNNEN